MSVVLKWPLELVDDPQDIGAGEVVLVDYQGGVVTVWTVEDERLETAMRQRRVRVFGTGHKIPDDFKPIGSCQSPPFVWHVFEWVPF